MKLKTTPTISLCVLCKNEASCISGMLLSVIDYVDEVVLLDNNSTDNSIELVESICDQNRIPLRVYKYPLLESFGEARTIVCHLGQCEYILTLDPDERLSNPELLSTVTSNWAIEAWALPRRRWLDWGMTQQTELEAYPDRQVRLFKNNKNYVYKRALHEYFHGAAVVNEDRLIIEHFHDAAKSPERLKERQELYTKLAPIAGVTIEGGKAL